MVLGLIVSFYISLLNMIKSGECATLLFAGDAMAHQGQLDAAKKSSGEYDFGECFAALAPQISAADFAVVNFETTIGESGFTGYPCFCSPASYATALKDAGFDLFLTANNHTLDRRDRGLRRTIEALDRQGISHIGTYINKENRDSVLPFIANINGIRVGFLNYTYGTNGITLSSDAIVDYIDTLQIAKDLAATRRAGAELLAVAVHWGVEYKLLPHPDQKRLADFLLRRGVDMVIGGHPHVIQPMEMRTSASGRKQLLIYSLGNFISNMKTTDTRGGAMAQVHVSRGDDGAARLDSASYTLVFTEAGAPGRNFRVVNADSVSDAWMAQCREFVKSAVTVFDKHNVDVPRR